MVAHIELRPMELTAVTPGSEMATPATPPRTGIIPTLASATSTSPLGGVQPEQGPLEAGDGAGDRRSRQRGYHRQDDPHRFIGRDIDTPFVLRRSTSKLPAARRPAFQNLLLGVLIGSAVGYGLVSSLADDGLGTFMLPNGQLAEWLVAAAVAGVLASVGLPARPPASTR